MKPAFFASAIVVLCTWPALAQNTAGNSGETGRQPSGNSVHVGASATNSSPSFGTPTLIQHVASSANPPGLGISGNDFKIPLPNPVGAANALILGMTYPSGSNPVITDNNGNTWPANAAVAADAGAGGNISSIWVLPNANAGQTVITVSFASPVIPFNYVVSEFDNIDTVSPINGTSAAANGAGPSLTTGSFVPGNNDANGGNLIWNYYAVSSAATGNPTSWVPGSNFMLLDADISWTTMQGFPHASQYLIQGTAAPINPSIIAAGDTSDGFNGVAVALKATAAGTSAPAGIHVNKIIHQTSNIIPSTWTLQEPATGNLRVLVTAGGNNIYNIASITDSDGGVWTKIEPSDDEPQIWYSAGTTANPNLSVTLQMPGASETMTVLFYDISGASANPVDTAAGVASIDVSNQTTVDNMPSITPTTANGLVIAVMGLGQGPGLGVDSPTGAVFDLVTYAGELDLDLMENADAYAHIYNTGTATLTWNWRITAIANNSAFATAVAFSAAAFAQTPTVTALAPTGGPPTGSTSVAITGTNLTGATAVNFGGGAASSFTVNSATSITATSPAGSGTVDVTVTTAAGTSPTNSADQFTYAAAAHDFNGDGRSDIAWLQSGGIVAAWLMNGAQILQAGSFGLVPPVWTIIGQRDFDGDGNADLLWRDTAGDLAIWLMNGLAVSSAGGLGNVPSNWAVYGTGDFNGDGKGDILWRDSNTGTVAIWLMNGLQVSQTGSIGVVPSNWNIVGTDGKGDIFWQDSSSGTVAIWVVNGFQVTQAVSLGVVASNWIFVGTGDFDGNGSTDILWRDSNTGTVAIWLMNGLQVVQAGSLGVVPNNWVVADTGDFNGDGTSDILWRDVNIGTVAIWFMNGLQISSSATVATVTTDWTIPGLNAE